jgi:hypothetical protein
VATIGFPPTLMVAGAWLYAAMVNRWISSLSGPASWAAGIIIEVALLGGESGVAALVDPHSQPQSVYVFMLTAPLIVGGLLHWFLTRRTDSRSRRTKARVSGEPWLALLVLVLIEAMFEAIKLHGHEFGLTWAMNGDAKNHISIDRTILWDGGITVHILKLYPALVNALCAILDGAGGRANIHTGTLMARDVQAMVVTFVLSCAAIAAMFVAALAETIPRTVNRVQRISPVYFVPLLGCATLGVGAYVFGLSLSGGFLSASGALALAMTSVVLGLRMIREPNPLTLVLLVVSFFLVVFSWTVLGVVPATAIIIGAGYLLYIVLRGGNQKSALNTAVDWLALAFGAFSLLGISAELYINRVSLLGTLKGYGGILPPNPGITAWVGVATLVVVAIAPNGRQRFLRLVMLCLYASGCAAALWLRHIEPHGMSWSYYATKMLWLATSCAIWIPFVIVTDAVQWIGKLDKLGRARFLLSVPLSIIGTSGFVWLATLETPFPVPFTWAYVGSTYPTPAEVSLVIKEANVGGPFVIWNYSQELPAPFANQYNDQIGNFWSALTWDYKPDGAVVPWVGIPYSFEGWTYGDNGTLPVLCQVLNNQTIRIVTSDRSLGKNLKATCPAYRSHMASDPISLQFGPKFYVNPL